MTKQTEYSPEVRERAVRMVLTDQHEHPSQWAAICSIAAKIGCTGETLRGWVRQAERDQGQRAGLTTDECERVKALVRENKRSRKEAGHPQSRNSGRSPGVCLRSGPFGARLTGQSVVSARQGRELFEV